MTQYSYSRKQAVAPRICPYLLWVDLVVELEDVHHSFFNAFNGEGRQVSILSTEHSH
jgi:hypothetical protein